MRALGRLEAGETAVQVARAFHVHEHTIRRLQQRHAQTGRVEDRRRSGRPRVTSVRQDRHMVLMRLRNRFKVPASTARNMPGRGQARISSRTVSRRLRDAGLRCH